MNKDTVLFHLHEAKDQLEETIKALGNDKDYDLYVDFQHLYHHVNSAWNGREKDIENENDEEFAKNRQFPKDINMSA